MESVSSLGEVATKFLANLPPGERELAQPEVFKFVRWYGWGRPLAEIAIPELSNYAEQVAASTSEPLKKLEPVKAFLNYAHKEGLLKTNLAVHLRVRKISSRFVSPRQLPSASISLTTQGYAQLEAELVALKEERPRIAEELRRAAADKDFRENAPLEAAREYQGQVEARIRAIEEILKTATTTGGESSFTAKASIGNTVVLRDLSSGEEVRYTLVSPTEAKPTAGRISTSSPIGKAIMGREPGETIEVSAPAGIFHYRIVTIE